MGWFWYLGTWTPVIGIVQVGAQALADRYTYVPLIGLFIIAAWGLRDCGLIWRIPQTALTAVQVGIVVVLAGCTAIQTSYWHDSIRLFTHALEVLQVNRCVFRESVVSYPGAPAAAPLSAAAADLGLAQEILEEHLEGGHTPFVSQFKERFHGLVELFFSHQLIEALAELIFFFLEGIGGLRVCAGIDLSRRSGGIIAIGIFVHRRIFHFTQGGPSQAKLGAGESPTRQSRYGDGARREQAACAPKLRRRREAPRRTPSYQNTPRFLSSFLSPSATRPARKRGAGQRSC